MTHELKNENICFMFTFNGYFVLLKREMKTINNTTIMVNLSKVGDIASGTHLRNSDHQMK